MPKTKIFVSFDFDHDRVLKDFIVGQAKLADSPFNVSDHSLKEAAPQADWERRARAAISRADVLVVMLCSSTRRAAGVKKEVSMARGLGKAAHPDHRLAKRLARLGGARCRPDLQLELAEPEDPACSSSTILR